MKNDAKRYYSRSMRREIKAKNLRLGVIKSHQARYMVRDLLGDESAPNKSDKNISEHLDL